MRLINVGCFVCPDYFWPDRFAQAELRSVVDDALRLLVEDTAPIVCLVALKACILVAKIGASDPYVAVAA